MNKWWFFSGYLFLAGVLALSLLTNHQNAVFWICCAFLGLLLTQLLFGIPDFSQKKENSHFFSLWGLIVLAVITYGGIYLAFFTASHLVFGDAPYFYPSVLKQLFNPPLLWDVRGSNFGGDQSLTLWLFLPTFLYGILHAMLPFLDDDWLIRLLFYFPGTILALIGSYLFIKSKVQSSWMAFLGAFLYGFNTYFLMVVDGGQLGVVLAYGLFPLVVWTLERWADQGQWRNLAWALLTTALITNVDLRLSILAILLAVVMVCRSFGQGVRLLGLLMLVTMIDLYWLIPLVFHPESINSALALHFHGLQLVDSLLLFQPLFPLNQFGVTYPPPFYFVGLLLLILFGISSRFWLGMVMVLIFLAKGDGQPFGEAYTWFITHVPFGIAFRDATKFYVPLLLVCGVLLSKSVERLVSFKKGWSLGIWITVFFYLNVLIYPAWLHHLSGVLNTHPASDQPYQQIAGMISQLPEERSLWFPEQPPLGYADWQHPALSANLLYQDRPFASMIDGNYDLFDFLHSPQLFSWLKLMNIGTAFFPEDPRQKLWTDQQRLERQEFVTFVQQIFTDQRMLPYPFPAYQLSEPNSHVFSTRRALLVLGGEEIYRPWVAVQPVMNLDHQAIIFLEDPRVKIDQLTQIASSDAVVAMVGQQSVSDLVMALHPNWLAPTSVWQIVQWGRRPAAEYLDWKAELLKGGIRNYDFPAGNEVFFSSQTGEKMQWQIAVPSGRYYLALRTAEASQSSKLKVSLDQHNQELSATGSSQLIWKVIGPWSLEAGQHQVLVENTGGFHAINGLALIPAEQFDQAQQQAQSWLKHFSVISLQQPSDWRELLQHFQQPSESIEAISPNPTLYHLPPVSGKWLVFTDHFAEDWQLKEAPQSLHLPAYALVNAFYISDNTKASALTLQYQRSLWTLNR